MHLSPRAIRFLIEAIQTQQQLFRDAIGSKQHSEDDRADFSNDLAFLESLKTDLQQHHDELIRVAHAAGRVASAGSSPPAGPPAQPQR